MAKKSKNENLLKTDKDRILELKTCLEHVCNTMQNAERHEVDSAYMKSLTLIKDVLAFYEQGEKYITAKGTYEGPFEFIN